MKQRSTKKTQNPRLKFDQKLILNQRMLEIFEAEDFDKLADPLREPQLEGFDEENISRYYHQLTTRLFEREHLSKEQILTYDQNIVRHWKAITEKRMHDGRRLYPKYFQYLTLLFTELYLDKYFSDPDALQIELNAKVDLFNFSQPGNEQLKHYTHDDLNKIAFWSATGSGKTLIMHINIRQYMHYLEKHGRQRELNRMILLTPNEGLSRQHLEEFELSGIQAELFRKEGRGLFTGKSVEVIDIHKLKDEMGEKTVAVDAFEGNNLVMVDEGHRGAGGEEWMSKRNKLCEQGFSFEYSATFGQAMKAAGNDVLTQEYAKCILFDYSYKFFYKDGYGKDYQILNLEDDSQADIKELYLTGCMLAFYQQLRLYLDKNSEFRPFLIEHPLLVFVGSKVTAVRKEGGRDVSDVLDILLFLSRFVRNKRQTINAIRKLQNGKAGLLDTGGRDIFGNAFAYLISGKLTEQQIYEDILKKVFNAEADAALHVENLKGSDGEIALRIGDNDPFGVINVGDAKKLCDLCEEHSELIVTERDFSDSLFHHLNDPASPINVLIGSKKFTEGWNSWRVSTMGLMNIGRSEGSEIIQLFGRGVRLKGYNFCLKRSKFVSGIRRPKYIEVLETLNIFGIRSDYMRQFKEYLEEEGLPTDNNRLEFILPVINNLGSAKLRMIRLKEGIDFKKDGPKPQLSIPPKPLLDYPVVLDWYPKIQAQRSKGIQTGAALVSKDPGKLTADHTAFMNIDEIYFELQRFKNERSWHNLNLSKEAIAQLLNIDSWYKLFIPRDELTITNFKRVRMWQEIMVTLLQKYIDKYYKFRKNEFEMPHLEYRELTPDDPNFIEEYHFLIDQSQTQIIETLKNLKVMIETKQLKDFEITNFHAIHFANSLYEPLIYLKSDLVEVKPVPLNDGERDFVLDLRSYHTENKEFFNGKELYLLRNLSRGSGIGFFEAGNFYPDFILWLLNKDKQYITFVDPKGIRNLHGLNDPKIQFYKTIKELELRLNDPNVILNSFILSLTPFEQVSWWDEGLTQEEFEKRHVIFKEYKNIEYIAALLKAN